jgi:hypothetical protein
VDNSSITSLTRKENEPKSTNNNLILTGWVRSFTVNFLKVNAFSYTALPVNEKSKPFTLKNSSFFINNIHLDRKSTLDENLVKRAGEIEVSNKEISITSADKMYEYKLTGLRFNTKQKLVTIKAIRITPQLSEPAFVKKARFQTDRFDINFHNIKCIGINVEKMMNGEVQIDKVMCNNNTINIFRDLSYPIDSATKISSNETFPHQLIHKLSVPLLIKSFKASNTLIEYKERNPQTESSGAVRFVNSTISIQQISNEKEAKNIIVKFTTSFLDTIPVAGSFVFINNEWRKGSFTVNASVNKSFNASTLNKLTEPMSLAKIEKGKINSLKFEMTADSATSHGSLVLPYQDFKISLLKKKGNTYDKKGALSLLANVVVKNNNKEGDKMRIGDITYKRNKYHSFFNYIWSTLFMGMKDILLLKI